MPSAVTDGTVAAKSVTEGSFSPGALNFGTTYYWRVDEVNAVTYPGDVWSFTTEAYAVVDDFESYTDKAGAEIFSAWIDGFDNPAKNGAVVGLATAANGTFGDTTSFHGGKQSMPFAYDNTTAPLSEAALTLAPAQDWTASGIKSLELSFLGAAGNTGQLYVKINNTKVPYNGNAGDLAKTAWQRWSIDLSTVAGGVSKVTKLTIGVEGAAPKARCASMMSGSIPRCWFPSRSRSSRRSCGPTGRPAAEPTPRPSPRLRAARRRRPCRSTV